MTRQHMMNSQDLVINEPFHEIEYSPAQEHASTEHAATQSRSFACCPEEHHDADDGQYPDGQMKISVLRILHLHFGDRQGLAVSRHADHMMPTEDLMEHDPIEKAAQAHSQNGTRSC